MLSESELSVQNQKMECNVNVTQCMTNCDSGLLSTLQNNNFDYDTFLKSVQCDNELSSVPLPSDMQQFKDHDEDKFLKFIRRDCELKLKEVRDLNKQSSVSAFMTIPALIGFLSKLAFYQNQEFLTRVNARRLSNNKPYGIDGQSYIEFVNRFILNEIDTSRYQRSDGLGQVLYKMVRCGLVHGQTVANEDVENVRVYLSHSQEELTMLNQIDASLSGRNALVTVVFNANVLCDAVEKAIQQMFDGGDSNVISSIMDVYVSEPPIIFVTKGEIL